MLVEHVFVTTSPADEALGAAARFLAERGFVAVGEQGFAVASDATTVAAPVAAPTATVPATDSLPIDVCAIASVTAAPATPPPLPVASSSPVLPPPTSRPSWNSLHVRRAAGKFGPAMTMVTLPQTIRLDFDRHRLTLAITGAEEASVTRRGLFGSGGLSADERQSQVNLLFVIARALEGLLSRGVAADEAAAEWKQTEAAMTQAAENAAQRSRRNFTIGMAALVALGVGVIAALAVAS